VPAAKLELITLSELVCIPKVQNDRVLRDFLGCLLTACTQVFADLSSVAHPLTLSFDRAANDVRAILPERAQPMFEEFVAAIKPDVPRELTEAEAQRLSDGRRAAQKAAMNRAATTSAVSSSAGGAATSSGATATAMAAWPSLSSAASQSQPPPRSYAQVAKTKAK
jgi:hypothetical protein